MCSRAPQINPFHYIIYALIFVYIVKANTNIDSPTNIEAASKVIENNIDIAALMNHFKKVLLDKSHEEDSSIMDLPFPNNCPMTRSVILNSWQSPHPTLLTSCPGSLEVVDRWGWRTSIEGSLWDDNRRASLLDVLLETWDQPQLVPNITQEGFHKTDIPLHLFQALRDDIESARRSSHQGEMDGWMPEPCPGSAHLNCRSSSPGEMVQLLTARDEVMMMMQEMLLPLAEKWSGINLTMSRIYGVRRYRRGSTLALHVDKLSTHVVSIILNIGQEVDQDWPLMILDQKGESHKLVMESGQMVFYESARLPHGRMEPLMGDSYDNIFVHFRPRNGWYNENWHPEFVPERIYTRKDILCQEK